MTELARALVAAIAEDPAALAELRELLRDEDTDRQEQPTTRAAYTVETLAVEVGRSPKSLRSSIRRGELQAVKRGGRWVISAEAVAAWASPAPSPARRRQTRPKLAAPAAAGPSLRSVFGDLESAS